MSFTSKTITFLYNVFKLIFLVFYLQKLDLDIVFGRYKYCQKPTRHGSFSQLFIASDVYSLFLFSPSDVTSDIDPCVQLTRLLAGFWCEMD